MDISFVQCLSSVNSKGFFILEEGLARELRQFTRIREEIFLGNKLTSRQISFSVFVFLDSRNSRAKILC